MACCKNEEDRQWYEYDDAIVTRVEPGEVMIREAYVLFYQRRTSSSMEAIKHEVMELLIGKNETNITKVRSDC